MSTDGSDAPETPLEPVMEDIRREIVRWAVEQDMDDHRDVYDALADE
jgi:hypothetical protein